MDNFIFSPQNFLQIISLSCLSVPIKTSKTIFNINGDNVPVLNGSVLTNHYLLYLLSFDI